MGKWGNSWGTDGGLKVYSITLKGGSALVQQGLPAHGPAIVYDKTQESFSSASSLLYDVTNGSEVDMQHDPDGNELPEVGAALAAAGVEKDCYCIAICADLGKWGVGVGSGWKTRERAAKLALAVALGAELPESEADWAGGYNSWDCMSPMALMQAVKGAIKGGDMSAVKGMMAMKGGFGGKGSFGAYGGAGAGKAGGKGGWGGQGGKGGKGGKGDKTLRDFSADCKVWVGNMPAETTFKDLQDHFKNMGTTPKWSEIGKNGTTGGVAFATAAEATEAMATVNGLDLNGQALELDVWTGK